MRGLGQKLVVADSDSSAVFIAFLLEATKSVDPSHEVRRFANAVSDAQQEVVENFTFQARQDHMLDIDDLTRLLEFGESTQQSSPFTVCPEEVEERQASSGPEHSLHISKAKRRNRHPRGETGPRTLHDITRGHMFDQERLSSVKAFIEDTLH